jgi:hypothetical protein
MLTFAILLGPFWMVPQGGGPAAAVAEYSYLLTAPGRVATCTTLVDLVHVQPFPGQVGPA